MVANGYCPKDDLLEMELVARLLLGFVWVCGY